LGHLPTGASAMPFSGVYENHPYLERARRLRANPLVGYGLAVASVAVATAIRYAIDPQLIVGVPFITYYLAIILAALFGGRWPGALAVILSGAAAWYLFVPPFNSWQLERHGAVSLALFICSASFMVAIIVALDVTIDRILDQAKNIRTLIDSAPNGILVVDADGRITLINPSMQRLFGYQPDELLGNPVEILIPKTQAETHRTARGKFQERPEARPMGAGRDLSGRRKDGSEFPIEIGLNPVTNNGRDGVLATVIDISGRRRVQEAQQLLIHELQHRTRNLFAVTQAVVENTLIPGRRLAEAKYVLTGRLQALARAYALSADSSWDGAPLLAIIERQLAGFSSRLKVEGCDLVMNVTAAQQFALITHELATNALKYGALSNSAGHVVVQGRTEGTNGERFFSFRWIEVGGPLVERPTRKGFGSVILIDAARQFASSVSVDYAPEGLSYELRIPLSDIISKSRAAAASAV
jgi:PAS domain S-box-containing protein